MDTRVTEMISTLYFFQERLRIKYAVWACMLASVCRGTFSVWCWLCCACQATHEGTKGSAHADWTARGGSSVEGRHNKVSRTVLVGPLLRCCSLLHGTYMRIRMVVVAPNIDEGRIEGGLDEKVPMALHVTTMCWR